MCAQDDYAAVYDLNSLTLHMTTVQEHIPSPCIVLGWNVAATARDLAANGVCFNIYRGLDQDDLGFWTSPDGRTRIIWFNDPEGNGLSLT